MFRKVVSYFCFSLKHHLLNLKIIFAFEGTMKKADILVADTAMAKVRNLKDHDGKILNEVPPGYPAEIEGWRDLPPAGEIVLEVESEKRAREVIRVRERKKSLEQQEKDAVVIAKKEEDHLREYKEKLQLKRKLGRFKLKREGPRKPEIEKGKSMEENVLRFLFFIRSLHSYQIMLRV